MLSLAWIPLLESALRDLASKEGVFVAPQSWCMITDGPEAARFQDGSELDTTHYIVNAILCNQHSQTYDERSFILPSTVPQENLTNYSFNFDNVTGIFHVASRFRCVSLKDLFQSPNTASVVEFSNGTILATPSPERDMSKSKYTEQDHVVPLCTGSSALPNSSESVLDCAVTAGSVSVPARKPFQEKGSRLTIDALASIQQCPIDSVPHTRSSSGESRNGTISTPATSAASPQFPSHLDRPKTTADDRYTTCSEVVNPLLENAVHANPKPVTWSSVQVLPSFPAAAQNASLCPEALDLVQPDQQDHVYDPLAFLDLAASNLKEIAYDIEKDFPLASPESPFVEVALDEGSGELYLQSAPPKPMGQSSLDLLDLDAIFGNDDDDSDTKAVNPRVKLPESAPVQTCMTLEKAITLNTLNLRRALPEETINLLNCVITYYQDIWLKHHKQAGNVPPEEQPTFHYAAYDDAIQEEAAAQFESSNIPIPRDTLALIQPFIVAFLHVWGEGAGSRRPYGRWTPGKDEDAVSEIAIELVEWQQMVESSKQTQSVQLRQYSKKFEEKALLSSFEWWLQTLGGDAQYRQHRRAKIEEREVEDDDENEGRGYVGVPIHHINFNGTPIAQRSYTPPEVSFWAASTTYNKSLVKKPSLPLKDENTTLKPLPKIHRTRVVVAQAFKWVDPTKYTGDNIYALWEKKGSALRNAATSDVKVAYQQVGTWYEDNFTEDDVLPIVAPNDLNYEWAGNGNYKNLRQPIHVYDRSDEHHELTLNMGKQPKHHFHKYATQIRSPTSRLQYELGAEFAKKAAVLEARLERRSAPRNPISFMNIIEEEGEKEAEDPSENVQDAALEVDSNVSEASTDIQDVVEADRAPLDFVNHDEDLNKEASANGEDSAVGEAFNASETDLRIDDGAAIDSEPEHGDDINELLEEEASVVGQEGDDLPEATTDIQLGPDIDSEPLLSPTNAEIQVPTLEDGRYVSPSKMVPSRMDVVRTPPQSPSKADDLGSWSVDGDGSFVSPTKSICSSSSLDEDEVAKIVFPGSSANPLLMLTPGIVQVSSARMMGKSWDDDDVFKSDPVNENDTPREAEDFDVQAEINQGLAAIARMRANRLRSSSFIESVDGDSASGAEEEIESLDGDNGITDHISTWTERPDHETHPHADHLANFSEKNEKKSSNRSDANDADKAEHLARFAEKTSSEDFEYAAKAILITFEQWETDKWSLLQFATSGERTRLQKLTKFSESPRRVMSGYCERSTGTSLESLIDDGEDLVLGPDFPRLIIGKCEPADLDDANIKDVLDIPDLDEDDTTVSSPPAKTEVSSIPQSMLHLLSPIREVESETDTSPIRSRNLAKSQKSPPSPNASIMQAIRSVRALKLDPNVTDEEFEEALLEKFAQEEKKRSGMTTIYDPETPEQKITPTTNHQDVQTSEEPSPITSGPHSRTSSGQISTHTSSSSLASENAICQESKQDSSNPPQKLNIDETLPTWKPLAQSIHYLSYSVKSAFPRPASTEWKKVGTMQWMPSITGEDTLATKDLIKYDNLSAIPSHPNHVRARYGDVAIAVGHATIELANWVFWKCVW